MLVIKTFVLINNLRLIRNGYFSWGCFKVRSKVSGLSFNKVLIRN